MIVNQMDQRAYLTADAIRNMELALRAMRSYTPPVLDVAAHGLLLALEHVRTLTAIEDEERKSKAKQAAPGARRGQA